MSISISAYCYVELLFTAIYFHRYMPWNLHEPTPGEFDFTGILDVGMFVSIAASMGLHVIIRPGPYICSEWDLGGLPP